MKHFQNIEGGVNPASPDRLDIAARVHVSRFHRSSVLLAILSLFIAIPVCAQEVASSPAVLKDLVVEVGDTDTRLIVDTEQNIVRVMIEGEEVGRFDKDGLHVRGDISYGGSLTDYGAKGFDAHTAHGGGGDAE